MNFSDRLNQLMKFLLEAAGQIFRPNEEEVPEIGVQPFEGEPASKGMDH